jgi:hypothetical protein
MFRQASIAIAAFGILAASGSAFAGPAVSKHGLIHNRASFVQPMNHQGTVSPAPRGKVNAIKSGSEPARASRIFYRMTVDRRRNQD